VRQAARDFLLREGTDLKYGARHLKRAIERHLVYPLASLLAKLSQGDATQTSVTIVEGWRVRDLREALRGDGEIAQTAADTADADRMHTLGAPALQPEGWFFPDTYFFAAGATDVSILARAYRTMQQRLDAAWAARASGLPFASPYEALILASIVEKETGRAADRPLIASVLVNRLQRGMRLQADPTVIYGLGAHFDGNLEVFALGADGVQHGDHPRRGPH
jgi:UPF0755 protein